MEDTERYLTLAVCAWSRRRHERTQVLLDGLWMWLARQRGHADQQGLDRGCHANCRRTVICATACVAMMIALNVLILLQQFAAA